MKSTNEQRRPVPFSRSYWVVPGNFLAGCYPGAVDPVQAHQKLKGLLDYGIRFNFKIIHFYAVFVSSHLKINDRWRFEQKTLHRTILQPAILPV